MRCNSTLAGTEIAEKEVCAYKEMLETSGALRERERREASGALRELEAALTSLANERATEVSRLRDALTQNIEHRGLIDHLRSQVRCVLCMLLHKRCYV
jgi:hypothetical protein